jgi:predicted nucleic acid-binding protein
VVPLSEGENYWSELSSLLASAKVSGPLVHDAGIAALCLSQGIRELWSADRDFSRFPRLKVTNPLV